MADLELVAFDIETTGFAAEEEVTVVGLSLPLGCRIFCQTGGRPAGDAEATVQEQTQQHLIVSMHDSELALLEAVSEFIAMRLREDDILLVAYNGETWSGGFDLPFIRTRFATHNLDWPFEDIPYADLFPLFKKLFNTTVEDDSRTDLVSVYELLCTGEYSAYDPFADSGAAVTAFEEGRFANIMLHNIADVLRTSELGHLAQRYCSKSDFQLKSLTASIDD